MKKIAIVGAGGFGRETLLAIHQMNHHKPEWEIIGFFDDGIKEGDFVDGCPVLGGLKALNQWETELNVILAIGNPLIKQQVFERIENSGVTFPRIIHPNVSTGTLQGSCSGLIVGANCSLTTNLTIGKHVLINLNCTVGHDTIIDDFCSIMPGANISGSVTIEPSVLVGTGAQILPGITISEKAIIGAGAVVTKDVMPGNVVTGVPAKPKVC